MLLSAAAIMTPSAALADEPVPAVNIVEHIEEVEGNEVIQPEGLEERIVSNSQVEIETTTRAARPVNGKMAGYRIQVFSDNNRNTAKAEANSKARQIRSRFPQHRTYVMFTSPYWRLRVGDFKTSAEASEAAAAIRAAFPAMSKEIRVVKDRVNITD